MSVAAARETICRFLGEGIPSTSLEGGGLQTLLGAVQARVLSAESDVVALVEQERDAIDRSLRFSEHLSAELGSLREAMRGVTSETIYERAHHTLLDRQRLTTQLGGCHATLSLLRDLSTIHRWLGRYEACMEGAASAAAARALNRARARLHAVREHPILIEEGSLLTKIEARFEKADTMLIGGVLGAWDRLVLSGEAPAMVLLGRVDGSLENTPRETAEDPHNADETPQAGRVAAAVEGGQRETLRDTLEALAAVGRLEGSLEALGARFIASVRALLEGATLSVQERPRGGCALTLKFDKFEPPSRDKAAADGDAGGDTGGDTVGDAGGDAGGATDGAAEPRRLSGAASLCEQVGALATRLSRYLTEVGGVGERRLGIEGSAKVATKGGAEGDRDALGGEDTDAMEAEAEAEAAAEAEALSRPEAVLRQLGGLIWDDLESLIRGWLLEALEAEVHSESEAEMASVPMASAEMASAKMASIEPAAVATADGDRLAKIASVLGKLETELQTLGLAPPSSRLSQFASSLHWHLARRFSDGQLGRARHLLLSSGADSEAIGASGPPPSPLAQHFPRCRVSRKARGVLAIAHALLRLACRCDAKAAGLLYSRARDVLNLFTALCVSPESWDAAHDTSHTASHNTPDSALIRGRAGQLDGEAPLVPHLALLLSNDLAFLANECLTLAVTYRAHLPAELAHVVRFTDLAPAMISLSEIELRRALAAQRSHFSELLSFARGFAAMGEDDESAAAARRATQQLAYELANLAHVWLGTLPTQLAAESLHALVDALLDEVAAQVLALRHVSASDSRELTVLIGEVMAPCERLLEEVATEVGTMGKGVEGVGPRGVPWGVPIPGEWGVPIAAESALEAAGGDGTAAGGDGTAAEDDGTAAGDDGTAAAEALSQETEKERSSLRRCRQLQWLLGARLNEVGAEMQAGGLDELKMENVHSMLRAIFNQQALIAAGWTSQTS